jgi:hypothetical protein
LSSVETAGLGQAARAGLPLPPGIALSGRSIEQVAESSARSAGRWPSARRRSTRTGRRRASQGGAVQEEIPAGLTEQLRLDDDQLEALHRLAGRCEEVYGPARDIEWAFAGGQLYLLQCRAKGGRPLRRDRPHRRRRAHDDDHRVQRARLLRAHALGVRPSRGGARRHRLEALQTLAKELRKAEQALASLRNPSPTSQATA